MDVFIKVPGSQSFCLTLVSVCRLAQEVYRCSEDDDGDDGRRPQPKVQSSLESHFPLHPKFTPPPPSASVVPPPGAMANHLELIQELQQLDKVPSLERLRAAQKRRTQQLKRWAVYEKEMQNKKRKADKKGRNAGGLLQETKRHVSFAASVALLEASARNDPDEGRSGPVL